MPEYEFSITYTFPFKDRIIDSVHIRENARQRKPVFWHILRSADHNKTIFFSFVLKENCHKLIKSWSGKKHFSGNCTLHIDAGVPRWLQGQLSLSDI